MRLYHFTSEYHLSRILATGVLRVTDPNLMVEPLAGSGVVWLLDMPDPWDDNLDASHGLTEAKTAVRITVDVPDARAWLDWLTSRVFQPTWVQAIIDTGGGVDAARHWWVVPRPIPRPEWIEVRNMRTDELLWT
jgi:hypothetical protein